MAQETQTVVFLAVCLCKAEQILQKAVVKEGADLGIAYDGDADRLLAVDEEGNVVDGDQLLLIFGNYLDQQGLLKENILGDNSSILIPQSSQA